MLKLDAQTTAPVLIDLQNGILPYAGGPHSADGGGERRPAGRAFSSAGRAGAAGARRLVRHLRRSAETAGGQTGSRAHRRLAGQLVGVPAPLAVNDSDILVTKRQWGAFYGTDLDLQLRRRGIKSVVLGGISTNIGVESTARAAREHGYELVIAEDVCSAQNAEMHRFAFEHIFPRLARVRDTGEILAALER